MRGALSVVTDIVTVHSGMADGVIGAIIGGLCAILGIVIGSLLTSTREAKRERGKMLVDLYADVFSNYMEIVVRGSLSPNGDDLVLCGEDAGSVAALIVKIEKTKLLCSVESSALLDELALLMLQPTAPAKGCSNCIELLRLSAKKDVGNRKRK